MNVNLQMNYWPTYVTNMAECAEPLINYIDALRTPGRVTAKIYAGVESKDGEENGFMAHTQNNPFGWTCPGGILTGDGHRQRFRGSCRTAGNTMTLPEMPII